MITAIRITAESRAKIGADFAYPFEEWDELLPIGQWLISETTEDDYKLISNVELHENFLFTNEVTMDGYSILVKKKVDKVQKPQSVEREYVEKRRRVVALKCTPDNLDECQKMLWDCGYLTRVTADAITFRHLSASRGEEKLLRPNHYLVRENGHTIEVMQDFEFDSLYELAPDKPKDI